MCHIARWEVSTTDEAQAFRIYDLAHKLWDAAETGISAIGFNFHQTVEMAKTDVSAALQRGISSAPILGDRATSLRPAQLTWREPHGDGSWTLAVTCPPEAPSRLLIASNAHYAMQADGELRVRDFLQDRFWEDRKHAEALVAEIHAHVRKLAGGK